MATRNLNLFRVPKNLVTEEIRLAIAAKIIELVQARLTEGIDAHDKEAAEYSPKGPVYLSLHGGKTGKKSSTARYSLNIHTAKHYRNRMLEAAEEAYFDNPGNDFRASAGNLSSSDNSMRFPDYAALKQFLGHPGYRDLELSGAMRRAITLTGNSERRVSVGFLDSLQAKKMRGNQRWADMWGLSPKDRAEIIALFKRLTLAEWTKQLRQRKH